MLERFGKLTPAEQRFVQIVRSALADDRIPGPTELNELMGRAPRNNLGGRLSQIRIELFLEEGLVRNAYSSERWHRPSSESSQRSSPSSSRIWD